MTTLHDWPGMGPLVQPAPALISVRASVAMLVAKRPDAASSSPVAPEPGMSVTARCATAAPVSLLFNL